MKIIIDAKSNNEYFLLLNADTNEVVCKWSKSKNELDKIVKLFDCPELVGVIK